MQLITLIFPSLMIVIKQSRSFPLYTHVLSLLVLLVKHETQWLVSNDVKW